MLEYAATLPPVNQAALVEAVSKGALDIPKEMLQALGPDPLSSKRDLLEEALLTIIGFTPLREIELAVERAIASWEFDALAEKCLREAIDAARGRV